MKTILILTADDPNDPLHKLKAESKAIQLALTLAPYRDYETFIIPDATTDDIIAELNVPNREIEVLHYAGHADGASLRLADIDASAQDLAEKLRSYPSLKFVFLNGCATQEQVAGFHAVGVPFVLATSRAVDDTKAYWLATTLYQYMATGQSLRAAFEKVVNDNNFQKKKLPFGANRGVLFKKKGEKSEPFAWGLYPKDENTGDYFLPFLEEKAQIPAETGDNLPAKKPSKSLAASVIALEIAIGILGELMPEDFKGNIKRYLGGDPYYTYVWFSIVVVTALIFIRLFLKYEGFLSEKINHKTTESGKQIVVNYQAAVNAKRSWGKRAFYYFFKSMQPDADFVRAIGLTVSEAKLPIEALNGYAPLHFSKTQDSGHETLYLRQFLFQNLENIVGNTPPQYNQYFLVLGESGCGKTTILYKVFCDFAKRFPHQAIIMREMRRGYADILEMKTEDKQNTILLLDGLDEDVAMIQNPKAHFEALAAKLADFKAVIVSSRTQLFKKHNDEPDKINENVVFQHLYLNVLSPADVTIFLQQKFKVKTAFQRFLNKKGVAQLVAAEQFIENHKKFDVLTRPFLLQHIEAFLPKKELLKEKKADNALIFIFEYQIYDWLIGHWTEREARIVVERIHDNKTDTEGVKNYRHQLTAFSQYLAAKFFDYQQTDNFDADEEFKGIEVDDELHKEWIKVYWDGKMALAQTHSLLSRNRDGLFHFAHRSIFEYFLAAAVFEGLIDERIFRLQQNKDRYAISFDFYNQMCWHRLAELGFEAKQELDDDDDCREFIDVTFKAGGAILYQPLFDTFIQRFDSLPVRAFLLGNLPVLYQIRDKLTLNEPLFVVLGELIYQKMKASDRAMVQLAACAEKLTTDKKLTEYSFLHWNSKELGNMSDKLKWVFHNNDGTTAYAFIHPLFLQYFQLGCFAGIAVKLFKGRFKTIVRPKRSFGGPLSIVLPSLPSLPSGRFETSPTVVAVVFFDLEAKWLAESAFFNKIKIWKDENATIDLLQELAFHELRMQTELFLHNNRLSLEDLRRILTFFPKNYDLLDVRSNLLRGCLLENEIPQNARFKIKLEENPLNDAQKAACLDSLRPYLHTTTVAAFEKTLGRGLYPVMVAIEGGTFMMGDNKPLTPATTKPEQTEKDNYPHQVTVNSFKMAQFQVTVRQFAEFMNDAKNKDFKTDAEKEGSSYVFTGKGDGGWEEKNSVTWRCDSEGKERLPENWEHPVIHVSWNDAIAYCNWLSEKHGLMPVYDASDPENVKINMETNGYRLPTEAEWEYAAGNGAKHTKYSWGNGLPIGKFGGNMADETFKKYIREKLNKGISDDYFKDYESGFVFTAPVGSFKPNEFGLFDMTGNVNEWCNDWYDAKYYEKSPSLNPINMGSTISIENAIEVATDSIESSHRVYRGGSWNNGAAYSGVAFRDRHVPTYRFSYLGFRLVSFLQ